MISERSQEMSFYQIFDFFSSSSSGKWCCSIWLLKIELEKKRI
jgi:hypothetical protein